MMLLYDQPDFMHEAIKFFEEYQMRFGLDQIKAGADAIGEGTSAPGSDAAIDIDGDDRTGETWDIGADQRVVAATGNPWWYYRMTAN